MNIKVTICERHNAGIHLLVVLSTIELSKLLWQSLTIFGDHFIIVTGQSEDRVALNPQHRPAGRLEIVEESRWNTLSNVHLYVASNIVQDK